jgi:hypothetical protein
MIPWEIIVWSAVAGFIILACIALFKKGGQP